MNLSINDKLIYFGAGCGVGLILGALFAPSSGQETRHNLTTKVDDLTHKVQDKIHSSGMGESAGQAWQNVVQKGRKVANIGTKRFDEAREAARRKFESIEDEALFER